VRELMKAQERRGGGLNHVVKSHGGKKDKPGEKRFACIGGKRGAGYCTMDV